MAQRELSQLWGTGKGARGHSLGLAALPAGPGQLELHRDSSVPRELPNALEHMEIIRAKHKPLELLSVPTAQGLGSRAAPQHKGAHLPSWQAQPVLWDEAGLSLDGQEAGERQL